tara:strand:+ start:322 stop:837 length:516 start_codon:yes stop_codon:yes gene_type:complete
MRKTLKTILMLLAFAVPMAAQAGQGNESTLKKVEAKYVCMINNTLFDKEQIPVEVDGKTYYGCCPMCKAKLEKSVQARTATDPVSGTTVDKATAIIGAQEDGVVHYFENEENLKKYSGNNSSHSKHNAKQCIEGEDCPMHKGMKHPDNDGKMDDMKDVKHNNEEDHGDHKH